MNRIEPLARLEGNFTTSVQETPMTRIFLIGLGAAAIFVPSLAQAQFRPSINNEAVCESPGYGMDPRCVGEQSPGGFGEFAPYYQGPRGYVVIQPTPRRR